MTRKATFGDKLRKQDEPPIEWLRSRVRYLPDTGDLVWAETGELVGCDTETYPGKEYRRWGVTYDGSQQHLYVHRVAFALMTGEWPFLVDHKNGNSLDNRWSNLREATASQNALNKRRCNEARHIRYLPGSGLWEIKMWDGKRPWIEHRKTFCEAWHKREDMLDVRARRNGHELRRRRTKGDVLAESLARTLPF